MKKMFILGTVLAALMFFGTSAMAIENDDPGASLSLESGQLTLNFSPGVKGEYITENTSGNEQWFAIGTYHNGGEKFYATSQQQTVVWKKDRTTAQTFTDAAIPTTKANSESDTQWTAGSWAK